MYFQYYTILAVDVRFSWIMTIINNILIDLKVRRIQNSHMYIVVDAVFSKTDKLFRIFTNGLAFVDVNRKY